MKKASMTQAKNHLSALVDQVRSGETILITKRGRPVARLGPAVAMDDPSGRVARLERAGVIKVGTAHPPPDLLRSPQPPLSPGASAVEAILDERRSTR